MELGLAEGHLLPQIVVPESRGVHSRYLELGLEELRALIQGEVAPFPQDLRVLQVSDLVRSEHALLAPLVEIGDDTEVVLPPALDNLVLSGVLDAGSKEDFLARVPWLLIRG